MFSHDKRYLLVFNGTIYNFLDLKKFLIRKIRFNTNSDTEVLVNSFSYWGKNVSIILMVCGLLLFMISKKKQLFFKQRLCGTKTIILY